LDGISLFLISSINVYCALEAASSPRKPHGTAVRSMCEKNAIRIETSRNQIKRLKVPKWLKHGVQNEPTKIDQNGSFFWTINEEPNGPKQIHHWMISFVRNHLGIRAISDQLTSMSQQ
jgi:hypothetical protein